jgi:hypothetical protein
MSGGEAVWRDIENLPSSEELVGDDVLAWWQKQ